MLDYRIEMDARGIFNDGFRGIADITCIKKSNEILILDLINFQVDSIKIHDSLTSFSKSDSNLYINIPLSYQNTDTIIIKIFYQGIPYTDKSWGGFYRQGTYAFNLGVGFSSNPHNLGRAWFPCVDDFTDRATYRLSVTTDRGFTAVCGGLLVGEVHHPDGSSTWDWQLNQPVPTYLASVAIGPYVFVKYEFTGLQRSIPVWLAAEAKDTANLRKSFVRLNDALQCFESRFGPYLFDRVGYVGVPFGSGAMEHAANIAYPLYAINGTTDYETLMAHELAHHWWGDLATCRTAEDMWLNEGWASFCEALFLECVYGRPAYVSDIREKRNDVMLNAPSSDKGFRAVSGVPHAHTYGTHVYKKGALMVNALRNIMGDTAFFAACKSYLARYRFSDVSSSDLRDEFQKHTTTDLAAFFDQYIWQPGHYDVAISNWNINNGSLEATLYELRRFKTAANPSLRPVVDVHFTDGSSASAQVSMQNGEGRLTMQLPQGKSLAYFRVDPGISYSLGHTSDEVTIKTTGVSTLSNTLLSINTQAIADSATVYVEHHWAGPVEGNLRQQGIRISSERYWTVRGHFPAGFRAWAFFNYNGTGYLDEELFTHTFSEDSLVLLHRNSENDAWAPVAPGDLTFQPGGAATDRMGRFWLQNLRPGDYAFGVRDYTVTGITDARVRAVLHFYPNPVEEEVKATLPENWNARQLLVKVYDNSGRLVQAYTVSPSGRSLSISTRDLASGTYQLIVSANGEELAGKLVRK